jgi:alpha-N-arabinofuranosidase
LADARVILDPTARVAEVDDRLFGSFVEHMGRAVYGGIFEPGHPTSDADGWRHDVIDLVRELGVTVVRYPGGNFVSGYDWEDGVGPRDLRPTRLDLAWRSIEPNLVGTDDFIDWTKLVGATPMLAVNLGTRDEKAARDLVEYCNAPLGSRLADLRGANGHAEPHAVKLWCLGNEMDGPWQIGHKGAAEYGALARRAGLAMRQVDPSIELVVCGSSGSQMPTFGAWEETVLDLAWDAVDYVSLHAYYDPAAYESIDAYLACSNDLDSTIETVVAIADAVARRRHSPKQIDLSVDEWNVWRLRAHQAQEDPAAPFRRAPAIAEDEQDLADALAVGGLLITLLRHADRVRIACLAQLVNVIPAIRTIDGGPAWRQTTSYPFADVARHGRGTVLRSQVEGPMAAIEGQGLVTAIEFVAVHDSGMGSLTAFAVNRADRPLAFEVVLRDMPGLAVDEHRVLADPDIHAANTADRPRRVTPSRVDGARLANGCLAVTLPARSWNVIRLSPAVSPRGGPPAAEND